MNKFTEIDRDDELCGILNALHRLENEIRSTDVSGSVRLEIENSIDSFTRTSRRAVMFAIKSGDLCQKASWPLVHFNEYLSSQDNVDLQAYIIYHKWGDLAIRISIQRPLRRIYDLQQGLPPCGGLYEGPSATIRKLSEIMFCENNNSHFMYLLLPQRRILLFLKTLCGVVARVFTEPDPKYEAEFRWTAAATGGALPPVEAPTTVDVGKAMTTTWDASRVSENCYKCRRRMTFAGSVRLMNVATKEVTPKEHCDYAAISYCWSSVKDDDDLLAKVRAAVRDTPIEFVWIDRLCLSSEPAAREYEVHHMSEVYANARLVIIFPGCEIPELDKLCYDSNGTALRVNAENCRRIGDQWTRAEWRNRCWTYQEASMARATAVVTGSYRKPVLSGAALDALATCRGGSVKLTPWHPLDDTWLRADVHMYQWNYEAKQHLFSRSHRVCGSCGLPRNSAPEKQPMLQLMSLSWNRSASKELDTVYSLLSMAEGGEKIPIDYEITTRELYSLLIRTKVVGAELLALGGGFVGPGTCWMPKKDNSFSGTEMALTQDIALGIVDADITSRGTLRAAVVPVSLSEEGRELYLAGLRRPLTICSSVRFDPEPESAHCRPSMWFQVQHRYNRTGSCEVESVDGCQIHALAPPTRYRPHRWALILIFSSGGPGIRHVEKTQVIAASCLFKTRMESLAIEVVEYGSRTAESCT